MRKSTHTPEAEIVQRKLVEMRKAAGLTQRQLAARLEREPSFVWRIENGERRVDVIEFYWICETLGQDAGKVYSGMLDAFRTG